MDDPPPLWWRGLKLKASFSSFYHFLGSASDTAALRKYLLKDVITTLKNNCF